MSDRAYHIMRFNDGQNTADIVVDDEQYPWPTPGIIKGNLPGGYYVKVGEDLQPASKPGGDSIRIAVYSWRTD